MSAPKEDNTEKVVALVDRISAVIEEDRDWSVVAAALGFVVSACEDLSDGEGFRGRFEFALATARRMDLSHVSQMS